MKLGMKKVLSLVCVASIVVGLVGCGSNKSDKNALEAIKEKKTLVVGTAPDFPPFEFLKAEDGKTKIVGADIDLGQEIADSLGVKLEVKSFEFDALIAALQAGKVDVLITGMTPTEKRKQAVDFSDIYYKSKNSLLVREDFNKEIKSSDDLAKYKVGVQKGSVQEAYVKETLKLKDTYSIANVLNLITDMKNGHTDVIMVSDVVAKITAKQLKGIKVIEDVNLKGDGSEESSAIAIKKGNNKALIEQINKVIKESIDSGKYQKMLDENIELASKQK